MIIALSSGHARDCPGASDIIDEVTEARRVVERTAQYLRTAGIDVRVFHDNESTSQDENLDAIIDWTNAQDADLAVSIHFNSNGTTSQPVGTECWYKTQRELAADVAAEIAISSGLIDRGGKQTDSLAFLNGTEAPAILVEVCFVNSQADCTTYRQKFDDVCRALAGAISSETIPPSEPGERAPRPEWPQFPEAPEGPPWDSRPEEVPIEDRPTLRRGDEGPHVLDMQRMIPRFTGDFDGDFGPTTEDNVLRYQDSRGLDADGICGPIMWEALYTHKLPVPPPPAPPGALTPEQQVVIMRLANDSAIADYYWQDRGIAPNGWITGMALAFGQTYKKWKVGHPAALEMAKARMDTDKDVLNLYRDEFEQLGMPNEDDGADTLRHLFALLIGHGMRESSGAYCEGRDMSADNVESDTAEAGAFQTSYNAHTASDPEFDNLMDEYLHGLSPGYEDAFSEGVSCSSDDWENYGSPEERGYQFQRLSKDAPAMAAEHCALTSRNLANHYGPYLRHETELKEDADNMLEAVAAYLDETEQA
jgi:peptidoglycan hydrolase-like protein with peptidoglycan-binding domain